MRQPFNTDTGHPPGEQSALHGLEMEQGVIGAAMLSPDVLDDLSALEPKHFFEPVHAALWREISWLHRLGRSIDANTVHQRMQKNIGYTDFGGLSLLADLISQAPADSVAIDYARHIADLWVRRELQVLGRRAVEVAVNEDMTADEAMDAVEADLAALQTGDGRVAMISVGDAAVTALNELDAPASEERGVYMGLASLDRHLGPLLPGDMIVLGGRPGMGKSALAAVAALNIACPDIERLIRGDDVQRPMRGVMEINTEMSPTQMARRHLTDICQRLYGDAAPAYSDIRKRRLKPEQRDMLTRALAVLQSIPLQMVTQSNMPVSWVRALARRQIASWRRNGIEPGVIIVDHVGHMIGSGRDRGRTDEQTQVSNGMKALARELQVPIICLSQLNRKVEERDNKRPTLPDLRDSGSWEQDADIVMGAFRDAYYAEQEPEPSGRGPKGDMAFASWNERRRSKDLEVLLLKVREGARGSITLWGDMPTNAIRDTAPDARMFS